MTEDEKDDRKLALQRYDIGLRYLIYENTTFWTRSQFLLIANIGLLGFVLGRVPILGENVGQVRAASWAEIAAFVVSSIAGLALCYAWRKAFTSGKGWINHWIQDVLLKIEEKAWEDMRFLREFQPSGGRISSATRVSAIVNGLFFAIWGIACAYGLACVVGKGLCGAVFAVK